MSRRGDVLVRYARLDDCLAGADLRAPLYGEEARQFDRIADRARRRQWLAGRVLARRLICETLKFTLDDDLQILSRTETNLGARPLVVANGERIDCGLSISHTTRGVLVALAPKSDCPLGVDLCDEIESFTPGFLRLWFTSREQSWISQDRNRAATIWTIKEAVFKAVSQGTPWNPREIEVCPANEVQQRSMATFAWPGRLGCNYRGQVIEPLSLALRTVDGHTAAIACVAPPAVRATEIRFSVPIDEPPRKREQTTAHGAVSVPAFCPDPAWIST